MKWTVKFVCHLPKQQTGFRKNTQMFMKARLDDEDDEEVKGKISFLNWQMVFKNQRSQLSDVFSFKCGIPVF